MRYRIVYITKGEDSVFVIRCKPYWWFWWLEMKMAYWTYSDAEDKVQEFMESETKASYVQSICGEFEHGDSVQISQDGFRPALARWWSYLHEKTVAGWGKLASSRILLGAFGKRN